MVYVCISTAGTDRVSVARRLSGHGEDRERHSRAAHKTLNDIACVTWWSRALIMCCWVVTCADHVCVRYWVVTLIMCCVYVVG